MKSLRKFIKVQSQAVQVVSGNMRRISLLIKILFFLILLTCGLAQPARRPVAPSAPETPQSSTLQTADQIPAGLVYVTQRVDLSQQIGAEEAVFSLDGEPIPNLQTTNVTIGIIIDNEGYIVTRLANAPASDGSAQLRVFTAGRRINQFNAEFVGMDSVTGLCVLKISKPQEISAVTISAASGLEPLTGQRSMKLVGFSPRQRMGKPGMTILNPRFHGSVATIRKALDDFRYSTSHPIYRIATSQPLTAAQDCSVVVDKDGSVFGLVAYDTSGDDIHLVYPLTRVQRLADLIRKDSLEAKRRIVPHAWLGATSDTMLPQNKNSVSDNYASRGVQIAQILPDSPAELAGMQPRDILLSIGGRNLATGRDLRDTLQMLPADSEVTLKVQRNKIFKTLQAKLVPAPASDQKQYLDYILSKVSQYEQAARELPEKDPKRIETERKLNTVQGVLRGITTAAPPDVHLNIRYGLAVLPLTPQLAKHFAAPSGVLIAKLNNLGKGALAGLKVGDVIVKVGELPVADEASLLQALNDAEGDKIDVFILRQAQAVKLSLAK